MKNKFLFLLFFWAVNHVFGQGLIKITNASNSRKYLQFNMGLAPSINVSVEPNSSIFQKNIPQDTVIQITSNFGSHFFIHPKMDSMVLIDVSNRTLEIKFSLENQQLRQMDSLWVAMVRETRNMPKEKKANSMKNNFDKMVVEILKIKNPIVVDWASVYLFYLEDPDQQYIEIEKFDDFKKELVLKFPDASFPKFDSDYVCR